MATSYRKPRKPLTPAEQLQAAIARVNKGLQEGKDYRVSGYGKRIDTGERFYCVPSDSEKLRGLWHVVTVKADGKLDCDCYYSREKHMVCAHRAVVYLYLKAKAAAEQAAQPAKPARFDGPRTNNMIAENIQANAATTKAQPDRASMTPAQRRETAYPASATRDLPFDPRTGLAWEPDEYTPRDYVSHQYR